MFLLLGCVLVIDTIDQVPSPIGQEKDFDGSAGESGQFVGGLVGPVVRPGGDDDVAAHGYVAEQEQGQFVERRGRFGQPDGEASQLEGTSRVGRVSADNDRALAFYQVPGKDQSRTAVPPDPRRPGLARVEPDLTDDQGPGR